LSLSSHAKETVVDLAFHLQQGILRIVGIGFGLLQIYFQCGGTGVERVFF